MDNIQTIKAEVDELNNRVIVYYKQDNSHLMSYPSPPPTYFREIFEFDKLLRTRKEYAKYQPEEIIYEDL